MALAGGLITGSKGVATMSQADFEYLMPVYRVLEEEKQEGWLSEEEFNREVKIYVEAQGVKLADFLAAVERMSEKGKKGA